MGQPALQRKDDSLDVGTCTVAVEQAMQGWYMGLWARLCCYRHVELGMQGAVAVVE